MRRSARARGAHLVLVTLAALVGACADEGPMMLVTAGSAADESDWRARVAEIPATRYTRDARAYIVEAGDRVRPHLGDDLGERRLDPVIDDVGTRYFDGARFKSPEDGGVAFDNLHHLASYLKSRVSGNKHTGEALLAHIDALVGSLTAVRLLADAAVQDAEATIGPFRTLTPPPPAPPGLDEAFEDLDRAASSLAKADEMLVKANPVSATVHSSHAWEDGLNVLTGLGITYEGDHDEDGVVDVVELRFGASPLLADSDGDGLTDRTEITQLAGWTMPNRFDTDGDGLPDGEEDIDGDGLTNLREQELGTNLTEPDTDGDGKNDGAEVSDGSDPLVPDQPPPPPLSAELPPIVPNPTDIDTDGDGLNDSEERDLETDPALADTDGDGLSDGDEMINHGIDPRWADTDGDGLEDSYEILHAEDQGLDPAIPDERVSSWTYVSDFMLGMFAGEFAPRDSIAWLSGNLVSGGLSFIPVVGWILGGLADIRDTIASFIHGDWVGGALSIVGLVPYVGDAIAIPAKAARFAFRFLHRLDTVITVVATYDSIPDSVKTLAIQAILLDEYGDLTGSNDEVGILRLRLNDDSIRRVARNPRTSLRTLARASRNQVDPPPISGGPSTSPRLPDFRAGEDWLAGWLQGLGRQGVRGADAEIPMPGIPRPNSSRVPDFSEQPPTPPFIHEVKTGTPYQHKDADGNINPDEGFLKQCKQDAHLRDTGQARGVHWHFPSHSNNTLGPTPELLDCLLEHGIPFTMYPPDA
jgi:hypothetical protein